MSHEREVIYRRALDTLTERRLLQREMSILVAAAGQADREVLATAGFANVTLTNLADSSDEAYEPFRHELRDLEDLQYESAAFDWAIVSAGLHHCRSPHRGLLELYRVARRGVIGIESRDSLAMRAALRLRVIDPYELVAVAARGYKAGGVRDGPIPNYVYRWTEREVEKTIASFAPETVHEFIYLYELDIPMGVFSWDSRRRWLGSVARLARPVFHGAARLLPTQANLMAFIVVKPPLPQGLQPWLRLESGTVALDETYLRTRFKR